MTTTQPPPSPSVYLLPLTDDGAPDVPGKHQYIYLPPPSDPPYVLRFSIEGTSSICREGTFWINHPAPGEPFDRQKFREFSLKPDFNRNIEIDIPVVCAGAFAFYTTFTPLPEFSTKAVDTPEPTQTPVHYIDVTPSLAMKGMPVPLDSLSIISCISKLMGKNPDDWENHMRGISQRGYNMVHFTPLSQRGISNSPYSLYDQLKFDKEHFPKGEEDVARLVSTMESQYGLLGLVDVVLNHTANNSKWLESHPEAGYNIESAPWLESALDLDSKLLEFSGRLEEYDLPCELTSVADVEKIMGGVKTHVLDTLELWQFYVVDVKRDVKTAVESWQQHNETLPSKGAKGAGAAPEKHWTLKQKAEWIIDNALIGNDRLGERYRRRVVPDIAASMLSAHFGSASTSSDEHDTSDVMQKILNEVNLHFYREYNADRAAMTEQLFNRIKYLFVDEHGPKCGRITSSNALIEPYFTRLPDNETTQKHKPKALALVNNGWIWAANALQDHAGPASKAYLRREVIVWGDCVKLRYGSGPKDNPFLWEFMAEYSRLMAKYFAAFRIDNCHSTPLHVAEYMLDQARSVRPNLAIFAELFTGDESQDFIFVKRLGISALIREAMQTGSTAEVSRLVHMHGGIPIGSFDLDDVSSVEQTGGQINGKTPESRRVIHRIRQSDVHALFFDCTHDNEPPAQKRDARDVLSNGALVSMCACATGSVFGYDECYPGLIDLVGERRNYSSPYYGANIKAGSDKGGIGGVKKILNEIHTLMGKDGYDETYIDHVDKGQFITVHRVHPRTRKGYFLVAHTAFPGYGDDSAGFRPINLPGTQAKCIGAWKLVIDDSKEARDGVAKESSVLRGLPCHTEDISDVHVESNGHDTTISVPSSFSPGCIALFETAVPTVEHAEGLENFLVSGARAAFGKLTLNELNMVLYRCDPEERDASGGKDGVYTIPNFGPLVYAGLQGWWSVLRDVVRNNDLGHPICQHIRDGQWAMEYCASRLERTAKLEGFEGLEPPAKWLRERFDAIRQVPSFLHPRYFAIIIRIAYNAATERAFEQMTKSINGGQDFVKSLALVSVQMSGFMNSASLYPRHHVPSLSAGLPHFSSEWARVWGRDVFISLRGLLLGTGRFANAREHILAFASVLKHGMIPNLLDSGKTTRYNSRDSIWFFLQSIQDYTKIAPNGLQILGEQVKRRFLPYDDTWFPWDDPRAYSKQSSVEDIIQEALQRHANGMSFREANAGPGIDMQMKDEGFNIDIHVDWDNGLVFGGSQWNCGTWMDKMGESEKAGSKGHPGTPRDGAAVEISGMLYSTLKWVHELHQKGQYRYEGVSKTGGEGFITFKDWAAKVKQNFERCYYVPTDASEDSRYDINSGIVNRRGIYKDLYRSGKEFEDYQLRPNFPIAMTVAPDLFDPEKALHALSVADHSIKGPFGMATLDPSDWNYRPNYNNSEDSTDFRTSKGRNYHQGPEWIWPRGYFLRALLHFDLLRRKDTKGRVESFQQVTRRLRGCMEMTKDSPWAGLTELTNANGAHCADSSPTQAWSAGCLIDLFYDAQHLSIAY